MPKKSNKPTARPRLVVYITPHENVAILKEARSLGLKNAHRWASMKLANAIWELAFSKLR